MAQENRNTIGDIISAFMRGREFAQQRQEFAARQKLEQERAAEEKRQAVELEKHRQNQLKQQDKEISATIEYQKNQLALAKAGRKLDLLKAAYEGSLQLPETMGAAGLPNVPETNLAVQALKQRLPYVEPETGITIEPYESPSRQDVVSRIEAEARAKYAPLMDRALAEATNRENLLQQKISSLEQINQDRINAMLYNTNARSNESALNRTLQLALESMRIGAGKYNRAGTSSGIGGQGYQREKEARNFLRQIPATQSYKRWQESNANLRDAQSAVNNKEIPERMKHFAVMYYAVKAADPNRVTDRELDLIKRNLTPGLEQMVLDFRSLYQMAPLSSAAGYKGAIAAIKSKVDALAAAKDMDVNRSIALAMDADETLTEQEARDIVSGKVKSTKEKSSRYTILGKIGSGGK